MRVSVIVYTCLRSWYVLGPTRYDLSLIRISATFLGSSTLDWMDDVIMSFDLTVSRSLVLFCTSSKIPQVDCSLCSLKVDRHLTSTAWTRLILSRRPFLEVSVSPCSWDVVPRDTLCPAQFSHGLTSCFSLTIRGSHAQCFATLSLTL